MYSGCVSGVVQQVDYLHLVESAGFARYTPKEKKRFIYRTSFYHNIPLQHKWQRGNKIQRAHCAWAKTARCAPIAAE